VDPTPFETVDLEKSASGHAKPVDASHVAMPEDADLRPRRVVSWAPRAEVQVIRIGQVEPEHDLQVRKLVEPFGGISRESAVVDTDYRLCGSPVVVGRLDAAANDVRDR
jgi:hypothetical protein